MDRASSSSAKRMEALLNEYKGNLYEFLVAGQLARSAGIEASFMDSITPDFYGMLEQQESFIREYYPQLLTDLPKLAAGLASQISSVVTEPLQQVRIIGKAAAGLGDQGFGEGDILMISKSGESVPVSVKLSKAKAFVNTKSAGVKSFLSKYFSRFGECSTLQSELSAVFDREFQTMAFSLHEKAGIEYDSGFENWVACGMTQLPGELPKELRGDFLEALYAVNNHLFKFLETLAASNRKLFVACLKPLLGYTRDDIVQATTYYVGEGEGYKLDAHTVESGRAIGESLSVLELVNRPHASSFDIVFEDRILQIRLKAMNKFTGKGFKVNCAVKSA